MDRFIDIIKGDNERNTFHLSHYNLIFLEYIVAAFYKKFFFNFRYNLRNESICPNLGEIAWFGYQIS